MKRLLIVPLVAAITAGGAGCSIAFQDSVRSSSVYCSTSRVWAAGDLVMAGGGVFALSRGAEGKAVGPVVGLLVASAVIGLYKRHNCVNFRETAPPEVWAAAEAAEQQRQAQAAADQQAREEAYRQALAAAQVAAEQQAVAVAEQQAQQQQQPEPAPQPQGTYVPPNRTSDVHRTSDVRRNTTVDVQRTVVKPAGTPASNRAQCDAILPLPPMTKSDPFGNAQAMQRMNRDSCYKCVDAGKTLYMEAPPPGFRYGCQ